MQRHESFLSSSAPYNSSDNGGLAPFDGDGHTALRVDSYMHRGAIGATSAPAVPAPVGIPSAALLRVPPPPGGPRSLSRSALAAAQSRGGASGLWQTGGNEAGGQGAPGGWGTGSVGGYYWYGERDDSAAAAARGRPELSKGGDH